ncbi:hypothetical protein U1Q18_018681 [Sarracenia purpurea var. burkii]
MASLLKSLTNNVDFVSILAPKSPIRTLKTLIPMVSMAIILVNPYLSFRIEPINPLFKPLQTTAPFKHKDIDGEPSGCSKFLQVDRLGWVEVRRALGR